MFKLDHAERSMPNFVTEDLMPKLSFHKFPDKRDTLSERPDIVDIQLEELEPTAHSSELNFSE